MSAKKEPNKLIVPTATMSNLVGMWAHIYNNGKLFRRVYIQGKADDNYYIVQLIDPTTGEPNVGRVVHIQTMTDWQILPTKEIAEKVYDEYYEHDANRYVFNLYPDEF